LFTTYNEKHALANIAYIANDTPPISVANAEKAGRIELRRNGQISQDSFDGEFSSIGGGLTLGIYGGTKRCPLMR